LWVFSNGPKNIYLRKKTTVKFWFLSAEFDIGVAILEDYFEEEE